MGNGTTNKGRNKMNLTLTTKQIESLRKLLGQALDEMDLAGNMSEEILEIYLQLPILENETR